MILFLSLLSFGTAQLVVNFTLPNDEPYPDLYSEGLTQYTAQNYPQTHLYNELAIADKRYRDVMLIKCHDRCTYQNAVQDASQIAFFGHLVKKHSCIKSCMTKLFGTPLELPLYIIQDFKIRKQYSFLQYAYYQMDDLQSAYECALTNLKYNKESTMMVNNVKYYSKQVKNNIRLAREEDSSTELYYKAMKDYNQNQYGFAAQGFNNSLNAYFKEVAKCKTLCEIGFDRYAGRKVPLLTDAVTFYEQFVQLYHTVLECRYSCVEKYNKQVVQVADYLPSLLNYLQFSSYQAGHVNFAAQLTTAYLVMLPGDQQMIDNNNFYTNNVSGELESFTELDTAIANQALDKELLTVVLGKKKMRKRLQSNKRVIVGDLGPVSKLAASPDVLWSNSY